MSTSDQPRRWEMFAGLREGPIGPEYADFFDDPRGVAMSGYATAHQVDLIEDPEGDLLGWIDAKDGDRPVMVQHHRIFEIQFPYGSHAATQAGQGTTIRLRVEPRNPGLPEG